ncbi:MAG: AfsR/SARP family transcriptional regulator [Acidimicrobiia bacterium]
MQELICYFVLRGQRPLHREILADRLWDDSDSAHSRKYLRQALWLLQQALTENAVDQPLLVSDGEWLLLNPDAQLWSDVGELEQAYRASIGIAGHALSDLDAACCVRAIEVYSGELLEGWYHDWCTVERERFRTMYLVLLEKLIDHAEAAAEFELGLEYAARVLRLDAAHERTHRRIMYMHAAGGNRSGALRQYEACSMALQMELGVSPSASTTALYEEIRADRFDVVAERNQPTGPGVGGLLRVQRALETAQHVVRRELDSR